MRRKLLQLLLLVPICLMLQSMHVQAAVPDSRAEASREAIEQLQKIENRAGTYEVELVYSQNGRTMTETVLMTITMEHTVIQEPIAIDAQNFTVSLADVPNLIADDWKKLAQAYAWNIETLAELPVQADTNMVENKAGIYPVTFVTDNGVATTVQAEVKEMTASGENAAVIYRDNMENGWYETQLETNEFQWNDFGNWFDITISGLLLLGFAIPIIILVIEYIMANQIIEKLIDMLGK